MKKHRLRIAVVALYLFLVASHLLLKFADTSRTWLQNRIVTLEYESALIFEAVLGNNYIITPADIYYGSNPYYYTYFDALYFWLSVGGSQSFRACAMHSELCYPGITYISESYSEEFFNYLLKDISINSNSQFTHYCINGIQAIGEKDTRKEPNESLWGQAVSLFTPTGSYILSSMSETQQKKWMKRCTN